MVVIVIVENAMLQAITKDVTSTNVVLNREVSKSVMNAKNFLVQSL